MRNPILFLIFFFTACGDIVPVDTVNLCRGDNPPSNECAQCKKAPYAADCPRCLSNPSDPDCADSDKLDAGGNSGQGGKSGSGGKTGGTGGHAMIGDGGAGKGGISGSGGANETGGSGGKADVDAGPCGKCPGNKPKCLDDECVECTRASDCEDGKLCDPDSHSCVECEENDDCSGGDLKFCDTDAHQCVQCLESADCPSNGAPQCNDHECGACTEEDACLRRKDHAHCDTANASATEGQCVQCLEHSDCEASSPQCNADRKCAACTGDDACEDRAGTTVCDNDTWADTHGSCVECTGTKYAACKNGSTEYVCDSQNRQCVSSGDHKKSMTPICGPCVSDAECSAGKVCIKMDYGTPAKEVGWFCQWKESATGSNAPSGNCPNARPFVKTSPSSGSDPDVISADHQNVTICTLRVSTCPALMDFSSVDCDEGPQGSPSPNDGRCGFDYSSDPNQDETDGNQDAYCGTFGAQSYRCTMPCLSDDDCKTGSTCDDDSSHCSL